MYNSSIFQLIFSIIYILNTCQSTDIHCTFKTINYNIFHENSCDVTQMLNIFIPNTKVNMLIGSNVTEKSFQNCKGLSIVAKNTTFLPINLGRLLTNLTALRVKDGRLKKIDKSDLKSMPKLRFIDLDSNDLEVIEKDLFQFNPDLECIQLDGNHIKSVGLNVFGGLRNLSILDMSITDCIKGKATNSKNVKSLIQKIEKSCSNSTAYLNYLEWKSDLINDRTLILLEISEFQNKLLSNNAKMINSLNESLMNLQAEFIKNYTKMALYESTLEAVETRLRLDMIKLNRIIARGVKSTAMRNMLSVMCGLMVFIKFLV